jgi:hypothetical protein
MRTSRRRSPPRARRSPYHRQLVRGASAGQGGILLLEEASIRTQLGYTYTDPDVVISTPTQTLLHEWRPHHIQFNVSVGFFPFLK